MTVVADRIARLRALMAEKGIDAGGKRYYHNQIVARCREVFLQYKYTGRFVLGITDGMLIYDWLRSWVLPMRLPEPRTTANKHLPDICNVSPVGSSTSTRRTTSNVREPTPRNWILRRMKLRGTKRLPGRLTE